MFKRGRTETLRVFSRESRHWVLSMLDPLDSVSHFLQVGAKKIKSFSFPPSKLTASVSSNRLSHLTASEPVKP